MRLQFFVASFAVSTAVAGVGPIACFNPDEVSSGTACIADEDCGAGETCVAEVCTPLAGTSTGTDPVTTATTNSSSTTTADSTTSSPTSEGSTDSPESSSGGRSGDTTPPQVVTLSPPQRAVVLDGRTAVFVDFDEEIDSFSLPSFVVTRGEEEVEGDITVDGSRVVFTVTEEEGALANGDYSATVTGVRDLADNRLEDETQWTFAVPESAWDTAPFAVATVATGDPTLVADARGNVSAVWLADGQLWSAFYLAGTGWEEPVRIDGNDETAASQPIVSRMGGSVIVAWEQAAVNVAVRDETGTWSEPLVLAPTGADFDLEGSDGGSAALIFTTSGGSGTRVDARYFDGESWSLIAEEVAVPSGPNEPDAASVAVDPDGVAVAVFRRLAFPCGDQSCQPDAEYWSATRSDLGTWTISPTSLGTAFVAGWAPLITAGRDGYFTATVPSGGNPQNMGESVRRFNAAGEVEPSTNTDYSGNIPSGPSLVTSQGHTILIYSSSQGFDSSQTPGVYASVYRPSAGSWDSENRLLTNTNSNISAAAGVGFSVGIYVDSGSAIARYCGDDSCFADPAAPVPFGEGNVASARAALTDDGLGVVLWRHVDGESNELRTLLFRGRAGL
ncbi:MAG: Ig-like domain-containing protein [Nannocystaceae bacterium]|nr:Ig-like domain-containing protein [Nannocystaceae bacterium]